MSEADARRYLAAAIDSLPRETGPYTRAGFPFHQALIAYETFKSQLAMAPTPTAAARPDNSELAHAPMLLSPLACPRAYAYAVHRRSMETGTREPQPTWLLVYRGEHKRVKFLELQAATYTLVLALKLASEDHRPVTAIELLLELAEVWDVDNAVQFVEQGLKLFSRLNDLGLIVDGR